MNRTWKKSPNRGNRRSSPLAGPPGSKTRAKLPPISWRAFYPPPFLLQTDRRSFGSTRKHAEARTCVRDTVQTETGSHLRTPDSEESSRESAGMRQLALACASTIAREHARACARTSRLDPRGTRSVERCLTSATAVHERHNTCHPRILLKKHPETMICRLS